MKKTEYTQPMELLADDDFFSWYYHTNENIAEEWNRWIARDCFNLRLAEEALCIFIRTTCEMDGITDAQIREESKSFLKAIGKNLLA